MPQAKGLGVILSETTVRSATGQAWHKKAEVAFDRAKHCTVPDHTRQDEAQRIAEYGRASCLSRATNAWLLGKQRLICIEKAACVDGMELSRLTGIRRKLILHKTK